MRVMIVGTDGPTGKHLADHYRGKGAIVSEVALTATLNLDRTVLALGSDPIDLMIIADDANLPDRSVGELARNELQAAFERLTFAPFRIAALLHPHLAAAKGTLVLLTRESATMGFRDTHGRYLERPFRAAAHALWRCYSIEWAADGITCKLLTIDDSSDVEQISVAVESKTTGPVTLTDLRGDKLAW